MDSENSGAIFRIKNLAVVRSPLFAVANKVGNSRSATKPQRDEVGPVSSQAAAVNQMFDEIYRATPMPSVILQQSNYNSKFWDQAYSSTQGFPIPGTYSGSIASTTSMHHSSSSYPYHHFGAHSLNSAGHSFDSTVLSEEDLNSSTAENILVGPDDEVAEVESVVEEEPTSERHVHSHNDKILSSFSAAQSETSAHSTIASEPSTHNGRSKQRRKYVMDSLFQLTSRPLTPYVAVCANTKDDSLIDDEDDSEESDNSDLDVKSAEKKTGLSFISNLKQSRMLNIDNNYNNKSRKRESNNKNNENKNKNNNNSNDSKRRNGRLIKRTEVSESVVDEIPEIICQKTILGNPNNSSAQSNEQPIVSKDSRRIDETWSTDEALALHTAQSQIEPTAPDFWQKVCTEMARTGYHRTSDECRDEWFQLSVGDNKKKARHRPPKSKVEGKNFIPMPSSDQDEQNDAGQDPIKRKRKSRAEIQRLAEESSIATKSDDIFSYQKKQRNRQFITLGSKNGPPDHVMTGPILSDLEPDSDPFSSLKEIIDIFDLQSPGGSNSISRPGPITRGSNSPQKLKKSSNASYVHTLSKKVSSAKHTKSVPDIPTKTNGKLSVKVNRKGGQGVSISTHGQISAAIDPRTGRVTVTAKRNSLDDIDEDDDEEESCSEY